MFVGPALDAHGFRHDAVAEIYTRERAPCFRDQIALPIDVPGGERPISCSANLAIHCPPLEQLARLIGADGGRVIPLALTRNIGQLMPGGRWHSWQVGSFADLDTLAADLAAAIQRVGLPWFNQFDSLAALYEEFAGDMRPRVRRTALEALTLLIEAADEIHVGDAVQSVRACVAAAARRFESRRLKI